jgi:hypothetical protein
MTIKNIANQELSVNALSEIGCYPNQKFKQPQCSSHGIFTMSMIFLRSVVVVVDEPDMGLKHLEVDDSL